MGQSEAGVLVMERWRHGGYVADVMLVPNLAIPQVEPRSLVFIASRVILYIPEFPNSHIPLLYPSSTNLTINITQCCYKRAEVGTNYFPSN